jgi:hypothetical protein
MSERNTKQDTELDRVAQMVVRGSAMGEDEIQTLASGIHYARVRARITAADSPGGFEGLTAMLLAARRAIPAMALVALLALALFWTGNDRSPGPASLTGLITGNDGPSIARIRTGGTCAISTNDQCAVSTDEVLATLVREEAK